MTFVIKIVLKNKIHLHVFYCSLIYKNGKKWKLSKNKQKCKKTKNKEVADEIKKAKNKYQKWEVV